MNPELLIAFVVSFGAGPLIYTLLLRMGHDVLRPAALGVVVAAALALWLQSQGMMIGSLVALWLAWILAVALVILAVRHRLTENRLRRWATILGLMATTLPWFGLATAQMMAT